MAAKKSPKANKARRAAARPQRRRSTSAVPRASRGTAYPMPRHFTVPGEDPFDGIAWERRTARITDASGQVVFEQEGVEVPAGWSQLATDLVASRYFSGVPGRPGRESSVRDLVRRIVRAITGFVGDGGALGSKKDLATFEAELAFLLLHQRAAFNSPVWFNVGVDARPQASACFILGLEDRLEAILDLASVEGRIFSKGSGAGTNFSALRGAKEPTRTGGVASGPVAFLRGLDALAGAVKSGGRTRRAAKMAILDADHPDVLEFVRSKAVEEERARALEAAGLAKGGDVAQDATVAFQNENHSVRVTDAFLDAVERDGPWSLVPRTGAIPPTGVAARALFRAIAEAAHACGDPGLHFVGTIDRWNPVPRTGAIRASNPCSEFLFLDDTACNLASINLGAFVRPNGADAKGGRGEIDVPGLQAAVRVLLVGMDALVERASYPTPAITRNSKRLRPLGLGLANLGSLLLSQGLAYDSNAARGWAGGLMALLGGEATLQSARLAARLAPFAEWRRNRAEALGVLARHRDATRALPDAHVPAELLRAARAAWEEAHAAAAASGLRNAQVTCVAPTGTISFLMDCDTTGIEPVLALHQEKKLVGGGRLRLIARSVPAALERLGYGARERRAILDHLEREGTLEGAPSLRADHLAVFDTAVASRPGGRSLSAEAHLTMMAAVQPFVSGAISKTVNLAAEARVEDVERIFLLAWRMGLKAVAVYRDRSKIAQPLEAARDDGTAHVSRRRPHLAPSPAPEAEDVQPLDRCLECGRGMIPDGACRACPNCGATTGCG